MFAIYLIDMKSKQQGYLKRLKSPKVMPVDKNGVQVAIPVFASRRSECKIWKREASAIKAADDLKVQFRVRVDDVRWYGSTDCFMKYHIKVINLATMSVVHHIKPFVASTRRYNSGYDVQDIKDFANDVYWV